MVLLDPSESLFATRVVILPHTMLNRILSRLSPANVKTDGDECEGEDEQNKTEGDFHNHLFPSQKTNAKNASGAIKAITSGQFNCVSAIMGSFRGG